MGIKDLWTILSPLCERKPLYELEGKTIAIDLSCWICESQNIAEYHIQPRMYLRNLYFRACCLLLLGVNPVFVLEGKAPTLKYNTIAARNNIQFKGAKPRNNDKVKVGKDRTRFNFTLQKCEQMLNYMGLVCVQGNGEAEAMCAYLNQDNFVDGCISQDSDCFAYGAKIVYRNFSISQQGSQASSGGSVDVYDITKSIKNFDMGRNKIITLALLCGSDYSPGVYGVGKDSALKFFEKVSDVDVLNRIRSWSTDVAVFEEMQSKISDKNICTSCGHHGKVQAHAKKGCLQCSMSIGCKSHYKEYHASVKNELAIRAKALANPEFPNEELITEFLTRKDNVTQINVEWKRPDIINFLKFTAKYLEWEEIYSFRKLLPILTRWQILNYEKIDGYTTGIVYPKLIKKRRNPKGVSSFEIIWEDAKRYFDKLIPDEQLNAVDLEQLYSTIEPEDFVQKAHPELVENFELSKVKVKKPTKRKKKQNDVVDDIEEMLKNTSITMDVVEKKPRKMKSLKTKSQNVSKSTKRMDSYFKMAILNRNLSNSKSNVCNSTPKKEVPINFDMSDLDFDCDDCNDLSNIVEDIVKRKQPDLILDKVKEIKRTLQLDGVEVCNFNANNNYFMACNNDDDDMILLPNVEDEAIENDCNTSNFFVKSFKANDSFEKSFNKMTAISSDDEDCTEEYELNSSFLSRINNKFAVVEELKVDKFSCDDDSFVICTTPLSERIKAKK